MKKTVIFLLFIMTFFLNIEAAKKNMVFYPSDDSDSTKYILNSVINNIIKLNKYGVVLRDSSIFEEAKIRYSGISASGEDLKLIDASFIVLYRKLDEKTKAEEIKDGYYRYTTDISVEFTVINSLNGEVMHSGVLENTGYYDTSKNVRKEYAIDAARKIAYDGITDRINNILEGIYTIKSPIYSISGNKIKISLGKNDGIRKEMYFTFVSYEVKNDFTNYIKSGLSVVSQVNDDEAQLTVIDYPNKTINYFTSLEEIPNYPEIKKFYIIKFFQDTGIRVKNTDNYGKGFFYEIVKNQNYYNFNYGYQYIYNFIFNKYGNTGIYGEIFIGNGFENLFKYNAVLGADAGVSYSKGIFLLNAGLNITYNLNYGFYQDKKEPYFINIFNIMAGISF